jgi:predicted phosphoribosyltransferase
MTRERMGTMELSFLADADAEPLFEDRAEAGRELASLLRDRRVDDPVAVVGLARGGVAVAAEVARLLGAPLDAVAVRKVGHPFQPEYALGAVTPGGVYIRSRDGLTEEELAELVRHAATEATALNRRLHVTSDPLELAGATAIMIDDGLATGATMIAAIRSARDAGAARVIAAVPVAPRQTLELVAGEADEVVCPHVPPAFFGVGQWYRSFDQLTDADVGRLLDEDRSSRKQRRCGDLRNPPMAATDAAAYADDHPPRR